MADLAASTVPELNDDYLYAGAFDGADPDARLDNAISAAVPEESIIYLEADRYTDDRTINKRLAFRGFTDLFGSFGPAITGTYDIQRRCKFENIKFDPSSGPALNINSQQGTRLRDCVFQLVPTPVNVNADRVLISDCYFGTITFASGTLGGLVDGCIGTSVTDNGSNTVGDIG